MSDLRKAAHAALDALSECVTYVGSPSWSPSMEIECNDAAAALRAALAEPQYPITISWDSRGVRTVNGVPDDAFTEPQPEPVAWYYIEDPWGAHEWHWMLDSPESQECDPRDWTPVYAAPQAQQPRLPLPVGQLVTLYAERPTSDSEMIEFAREVERAHGIGKP